MAFFEVDEHSGIPIWVQLRNRLAYLIETGQFKNGDRLPTVRAIAADININYHTVNKVYTSLEHDGYVSSKRGKGVFVTWEMNSTDRATTGDVIINESIRQCLELGMTLDDIERRFQIAVKGFLNSSPDKESPC